MHSYDFHFPSQKIKNKKLTHISIKLANKAGKVVMLEIVREKITRKLRRAPDDEGGVVFAPRDDMVGGGIVDQLIRLGQKRRRNGFLRV